MSFTKSKSIWQVISLGVLAGMRTTSAPAIAGHILSRHQTAALSNSPLKFMQNEKVAFALKLLAVGELVGDKLPNTPDRIAPGGLIFRCASGSLAGSAIFKASGKNALAGAAVGSITALGAAFASYFIRKNIVLKLAAPDPVIGAIEDALVIGAGIAIITTA